MTKRLTLGALALALALGAVGCVHRHHHRDGPDKVAVLETEHGKRHILVVHEKPGPNRVCWKHRRHWHCRR